MMRSKSHARSYLTLVSSSTHMPRRTQRGWPEHYPIIHPLSEVRYRPTHLHTKLISSRIPYVSYASVHFKCWFNRAQPMQALIDIGGGLPPWSSEFHIRPLILLPIQYSPISPNCVARSPIIPTI
jgi:hypothetical protein